MLMPREPVSGLEGEDIISKLFNGEANGILDPGIKGVKDRPHSSTNKTKKQVEQIIVLDLSQPIDHNLSQTFKLLEPRRII